MPESITIAIYYLLFFYAVEFIVYYLPIRVMGQGSRVVGITLKSLDYQLDSCMAQTAGVRPDCNYLNQVTPITAIS